MYEQVLKLFGADTTRPGNKNSKIEILAIQAVANARLHQFPEAEKTLTLAEQLCQESLQTTCGDVMRGRGVLAVQHGQIDIAKQSFGQSLQFSRTHSDHFLEETALLNLGATSLREGHFDEAIDWTEAAYQASTALDADGEAQAALGNLGWAYYNLGDSERSLQLSLEAEKRAVQVGDVIDELYWTTNAGYVHASLGDLAGARDSYRKALDLATSINSKEGIYNALRALALVSVEGGDLQEANKYSDEAFAIARADNNRLDQLYPLLVKGLIASRSGNSAEAENMFREVEQDHNGNPPLKWRSEHGLARLYEDEKRPAETDREYRAALATFEEARSSLQRNDSRLPFSNNASRIYDDYVHFLVAQGKTAEALRWADYSRARTLSEGLGQLSKEPTRHAKGQSRLEPPPLNAQAIAVRARGTILFYWLGETHSYLWMITPEKTSLFPLPPRAEIDSSVQHYRRALTGPQDVLASANEDGLNLYRTLIAPAQALLTKDPKVFIIPDGGLNNLNFETLIVAAPKPHFWIEDAEVVNASSLRVLAASFAREDAGRQKHSRKLLLLGDSVPPSKDFPALPLAAEQMSSVAKHFSATEQQVYRGARATPGAYLDSNPGQFSYIHFVAHGTGSRLSPLDSAIVLSSRTTETNSFKLYARDIIQHPLQADLVTISACYGAGERSYSGEGLVGLAWAFLRAGAHNVIAGLWEVTDASTEQLMDRFYDALDKGQPPDAALRAAKLALLHGTAFHNPFYWAPFQLYTGS